MIAYQDSTIVNDGTLLFGIIMINMLSGRGMVAGSNGSSAINNGVINIRPFKNAFAPEGLTPQLLLVMGAWQQIKAQ